MTEMLTCLSSEASYLGVTALSLAYDLAGEVAAFNARAKHVADESGASDSVFRLTSVRSKHGAELKTRADALRKGLNEVTLLLWDAVWHSEPGSRERTLNFKDDMQTEMGK